MPCDPWEKGKFLKQGAPHSLHPHIAGPVITEPRHALPTPAYLLSVNWGNSEYLENQVFPSLSKWKEKKLLLPTASNCLNPEDWAAHQDGSAMLPHRTFPIAALFHGLGDVSQPGKTEGLRAPPVGPGKDPVGVKCRPLGALLHLQGGWEETQGVSGEDTRCRVRGQAGDVRGRRQKV